MDYNGTGTNPKDPAKELGPENERRLLQAFGKIANGAPSEVVLGAAINMVVNVLRQSYPNYEQAVTRLDDRVALMKTILQRSYDQVTGNRKSVFPFDQFIYPQLLNSKDKLNS